MKHFISILFALCIITFAIGQTFNTMLCNSAGTTCTQYINLTDANNKNKIYLINGTFITPNIDKKIRFIRVGENINSCLP